MQLQSHAKGRITWLEQREMKKSIPIPESMKSTPVTLAFHLQHPDVDAITYTQKRRRDWGKQAASKRRIYLDTKYWIYVRDVYLGREQKPIHVQIASELRRLRECGSTICPISYPVFAELLYQTDKATRGATAKMIDELSGGFAIQPPDPLFGCEFVYFYHRIIHPQVELIPIEQMVWTRVGFVLGDTFISLDDNSVDPLVANAIQKAMDDVLWSCSFEDMVEVMPLSDGTDQRVNHDLASKLTSGKFEHQKAKDQFHSLFLDEVDGVLESHHLAIGEYLQQQAVLEGKSVEGTSKPELCFAGKMVSRMIREAFRNKRITTEMPSVSIPAALHALVRLDRTRNYKKGDFEDFRHATSAIGYCDMFLTEASLRHLVYDSNFGCESNYQCVVLSDCLQIYESLSRLS